MLQGKPPSDPTPPRTHPLLITGICLLPLSLAAWGVTGQIKVLYVVAALAVVLTIIGAARSPK
jgi:hypothetical protein